MENIVLESLYNNAIIHNVSISRVVPIEHRRSLANFDKCMLCVSLKSRNAEGSRLKACAEWISERFAECLVVPVDTVYRYTLQITEEMEKTKSIQGARLTAQEFINQQWHEFEPYMSSCRFELRPFSVVEKSFDFSFYHQQLLEFYANDAAFQTSVNDFAYTYVNRIFPNDEAKLNSKLHLAVAYFLEEAASFSCLVDEGWNVFVYPGSIKPFENIAMGKHPNVVEPLKNLIWVGLRLKKKRSAVNNEFKL